MNTVINLRETLREERKTKVRRRESKEHRKELERKRKLTYGFGDTELEEIVLDLRNKYCQFREWTLEGK